MQDRHRSRALIVCSDRNALIFFSRLLPEVGFETLRCHSIETADDHIVRLKPSILLIHADDPCSKFLLHLGRLLMRHSLPTLLASYDPDSITDTIRKGIQLGAVDVIPIPEKNETFTEAQEKRILRIISGAAALKHSPVSFKNVISILRETNGGGADALEREFPNAVDSPLNALQVDAVGLAISTGGPNALSHFVPSLPAGFPPPVLVVQHIIPGFIKSVVARLGASCSVRVKIAEDGEVLESGTVYFAPDSLHLKVVRGKSALAVRLDPEPSGLLFRPSADVLFKSLVEACGSRCLGVIMTGMGKDGVDGLRAIKQGGGITMAQDRSTSTIYGMARVAVDENIIDHVVPLDRMASEIYRIISCVPPQ